MDKIKKYISNFSKEHEENRRFTMSISEILEAVNAVKGGKPAEVISYIFSYGYAKGYRACQAERKKGDEKVVMV